MGGVEIKKLLSDYERQYLLAFQARSEAEFQKGLDQLDEIASQIDRAGYPSDFLLKDREYLSRLRRILQDQVRTSPPGNFKNFSDFLIPLVQKANRDWKAGGVCLIQRGASQTSAEAVAVPGNELATACKEGKKLSLWGLCAKNTYKIGLLTRAALSVFRSSNPSASLDIYFRKIPYVPYGTDPALISLGGAAHVFLSVDDPQAQKEFGLDPSNIGFSLKERAAATYQKNNLEEGVLLTYYVDLALELISSEGHSVTHSPKLSRAEKLLQQALKIDPSDVTVLLNLGDLYFKMRKLPLAEKHYHAAAKQDEHDPRPYYNLAVLYSRRNVTKEREYLAEALKRDPHSPKTVDYSREIEAKTVTQNLN